MPKIKINFHQSPIVPEKLKEDENLSKNCQLYMTKLAIAAFSIGFFVSTEEQMASDLNISIGKMRKYNVLLQDNRYLDIYETATDFIIYAPCFLHIYQITGNI